MPCLSLMVGTYFKMSFSFITVASATWPCNQLAQFSIRNCNNDQKGKLQTPSHSVSFLIAMTASLIGSRFRIVPSPLRILQDGIFPFKKAENIDFYFSLSSFSVTS